MPTKPRVMIFFIILSVMLLAKYMWGQDVSESVGWDPQNVCFAGPTAEAYGMLVVIFGPIFGVATGLKMAWDRHRSAETGRLFQTEITGLGL